MPRRYPNEIRRQVIELARSGTKVAQLVATFGMSEATIYNWLRQEQIDRGEISGTSKTPASTRATPTTASAVDSGWGGPSFASSNTIAMTRIRTDGP